MKEEIKFFKKFQVQGQMMKCMCVVTGFYNDYIKHALYHQRSKYFLLQFILFFYFQFIFIFLGLIYKYFKHVLHWFMMKAKFLSIHDFVAGHWTFPTRFAQVS